ncbi:hypothetical protein LSTR_LSTR008233, partial [Laodelphax striatellus]
GRHSRQDLDRSSREFITEFRTEMFNERGDDGKQESNSGDYDYDMYKSQVPSPTQDSYDAAPQLSISKLQ